MTAILIARRDQRSDIGGRGYLATDALLCVDPRASGDHGAALLLAAAHAMENSSCITITLATRCRPPSTAMR
jgi:hypothetical protein